MSSSSSSSPSSAVNAFSNVDVLVMPHHGSEASKELEAIWDVVAPHKSGKPLLTIISSDPSKSDKIPKTESLKKLVFGTNDGEYFCLPHVTSANYMIGVDAKIMPTIQYDTENDSWLPLFCTFDTDIGYKITISFFSITSREHANARNCYNGGIVES